MSVNDPDQRPPPTSGAGPSRFRVRAERCSSCVYRLPYPKETRDALLADVAAIDGYVQCHDHADSAHVCCRGYWDAVGQEGGTPVQLAWRMHQLGWDVIEWVQPGSYPPGEEEA